MRYANIGNYIRAGSLGAAGALGALAATQASSPDFADQQRLALNLQGQRQVLIQDLESPAKAYLSKVAAASDAADVAKVSYQRKQIEQAKAEKRKAGRIAAAAEIMKLNRNRPDDIIPQLSAELSIDTAAQDDRTKRLEEIGQRIGELSAVKKPSSSSGSSTTISPSTSSGTISGPADAQKLFTYMTEEKGMTPIHAKGLLANMIRESSLKTSNPGDDGYSDGLFQWHKDRLARARQYLGDDWDNPYRQIDYALIEPNEPGQQYLSTNFDSEQASADWWMRHWERPRHQERDSQRHTEILGSLGF